ncbi:MAG: hypothetical protein MJK12_01625 [Colwellia sp.]|nr:hypothetical protein [Colwellia sp.]
MVLLRFIVLVMLLVFSLSHASNIYAANFTDYLPKEQNYQQSIPTPESVLGFGIGERHVRHHQLVNYFQQLTNSSERIQLTEIGKTSQFRQQLLVTISSPENLNNLDEILAKRNFYLKQVTDGDEKNDGPLIIWLGYSVHGDEASGANAAMLVAYHYVASQSEQITSLLENTIIVLEPSINPDGLDRFVNWVSTFSNDVVNDDPNDIEHHQGWPTGRTNHYWFDLNRDWLLLTQQESRNRLKYYHQYQPNVVGDFHEMSRNGSYFFQPGVPSRTHPLTPKGNGDLTRLLARYHAKSLDKEQRLYYSEEVFDDFYYGKGSTYPDINGSIGILFEQASSNGMQQQSINGLVTFEFGIKNHVLTSLSTVEGAWENKQQLINYRQDFYRQAIKLASKENFNGYLIHADNDYYRINRFLNTLKQHQIEVYPLTSDFRHDGKLYTKKQSYYVSLEQPQFRVIQALFNQQTNFKDNTFYDVSGWTLPLAMNIEFHKVDRTRGLKLAENSWQMPQPATILLDEDAYAYVFEWHHSLAPQLLERLLDSNIKAKVATKSFVSDVQGVDRTFKAGSILIAAGWQNVNNWRTLLSQASSESNIDIFSLSTGLTPQGIDLGSSSFSAIAPVKVLLIGGKNISEYEAGEVRYYLNETLNIPLSVVEQHRVNSVDLSSYSHIILVDGNYNNFSKRIVQKLSHWIKNGGVVFAQKRAAKWLADNEILSASFISQNKINQLFSADGLRYKDKEKLAARKRIAGAIFKTTLDNSHPIAYGFESNNLPLFRNSTLIMKGQSQPFTSVVNYTDSPLISGFSDKNLVNVIAHNPAVIAHSLGKGRVIASSDNLIFRGYWLGSAKLLANSLYFSKAFNTPIKE